MSDARKSFQLTPNPRVSEKPVSDPLTKTKYRWPTSLDDASGYRLLIRLLSIAAYAVCLLGCANPMKRLQNLQEAHALQAFEIDDKGTRMRVFAKAQQALAAHKPLRVYLGGDGRPWIWGGQEIAKNPNGSKLIGLHLMLADPAPALYLSRPCYGFDEVPDSCSSEDWTSGRYSEAIVSAMNAALTQLKDRYQARELELVGFSGGGSLAVLLAARREDVSKLVTLAANLDHQAWTQHFRYLPLENSLNALDVLPLPLTLERWHHVGMRDTRVPPKTQDFALAKDRWAEVKEHREFDHSCCWVEAWPQLLDEMGMTD